MFFDVFLHIFYINMLKVSQQNNTKNIIVIFEKIKKLSSNCISKRYLNEFSFFLFLWLQFFYVKEIVTLFFLGLEIMPPFLLLINRFAFVTRLQKSLEILWDELFLKILLYHFTVYSTIFASRLHWLLL